MHMFARNNYVKLLKPSGYGQHLVMNKAYFATSTKGWCLFVEPLIDCANDEFDKYLFEEKVRSEAWELTIGQNLRLSDRVVAYQVVAYQ